eukprot:UN24757
MGSYFFAPIVNYMDFEESLDVVFETMQTERYVIFSWDVYFSQNSEYLTKIQREHTMLLVSIDGFYNLEVPSSSTLTWKEFMEHGEKTILTEYALKPDEMYRASGRNNASGLIEYTRMDMGSIFTRLKKECSETKDENRPCLHMVSPVSSPDLSNHVVNLLPFRRRCLWHD